MIQAPLSPGTPVSGFYKVRLVRAGPFVAVRIFFGPGFEPHTREEQDRSHRWRAERAGIQVDVFDVWPWCARYPITEADYRYMEAVRQHAERYEPEAPESNPRQAVELSKLPLPF